MSTPTIAIESPEQPEVSAMFDDATAYYESLYPGDASYLPTVEDLSQPDTDFWVLRDADGQAVGCGALVHRRDGWGEIKRMYVSPSARGRALGTLILDTIETRAKTLGFEVLRLETGQRQVEAVSLYRSRGYQPRGPFGDHDADQFSLFMEKKL
jgi:putative acetyltransferase